MSDIKDYLTQQLLWIPMLRKMGSFFGSGCWAVIPTSLQDVKQSPVESPSSFGWEYQAHLMLLS